MIFEFHGAGRAENETLHALRAAGFALDQPCVPLPQAGASGESWVFQQKHLLPKASCFLSGRLSRPVKKTSFLCDLCASVVNILFRCAVDRFHSGDCAGAERVPSEMNEISRRRTQTAEMETLIATRYKMGYRIAVGHFILLLLV